jgi:hypothetical protein
MDMVFVEVLMLWDHIGLVWKAKARRKSHDYALRNA